MLRWAACACAQTLESHRTLEYVEQTRECRDWNRPFVWLLAAHIQRKAVGADFDGPYHACDECSGNVMTNVAVERYLTGKTPPSHHQHGRPPLTPAWTGEFILSLFDLLAEGAALGEARLVRVKGRGSG